MSIIDYTKNQQVIPPWLQTGQPLRLILWAGDGFHEICDVERLPTFDIYLCQGWPLNLQKNIDYIEQNKLRKIICIINANDSTQMSNFCSTFARRFSHIDADYMGNTPKLDLKYYEQLIAPGGFAYNIRGINAVEFPAEDFFNALELFAPILPAHINVRRLWIDDIQTLATENNLTREQVWSSRDLDVHYHGLVVLQKHFRDSQLKRSPEYLNTYMYNEATLEEYWSKLPLHILTVNLERAWRFRRFNDAVVKDYYDRFAKYLKSKLVLNADIEKYISGDSLRDIQHCFNLQSIAPPNSRIGYFPDARRPQEAFDIILQF